MMHILKCATAGAAFSASAVIAGAVTWTLVQSYRDRQHMVEYWQRRRLEEAMATHADALVLPGQRPAPDAESAFQRVTAC